MLDPKISAVLLAAGVLGLVAFAATSGHETPGKFAYVVETDGMQFVDLDGDGFEETAFSIHVVVNEGVARGYAFFLNAESESIAIFDSGEVDPTAGPSADLGGMLYRTTRDPLKTVDSHPQEVLDLVAAATADLSGGLSLILLLSNGESTMLETAGKIRPLHDRVLIRR